MWQLPAQLVYSDILLHTVTKTPTETYQDKFRVKIRSGVKDWGFLVKFYDLGLGYASGRWRFGVAVTRWS